MNNWYEPLINQEGPVKQGEVIFKCPVLFPDPDLDYRTLDNPAQVTYTKEDRDVIVMTQGCDLQKAKPGHGVVLCPVTDLSEIPKEGKLGNLRINRIESLHLLNKCDEHGVDYLIVDFSTTYVVPFGVLNTWLKGLSEPRLILTSPFLEQMSQRFGNYYARIGIEDEDQPQLDKLQARWKELHPSE